MRAFYLFFNFFRRIFVKEIKTIDMNYTEQELSNEQWIDCLGYDGLYMVSDLGRIKSYDRIIHRKDGRYYTQKGRIMKLSCSQERLTISLTDEHSISKTHLVSNLVFFSFNPKIERKEKQEISLKDKSHYNVRLNNLELVDCKTSKKICYDNGIQLHLKSTIALRKRGDELVNLKTRVCIKCNKERDIEKFKDIRGGRVTRKTCIVCKVERNKERLLSKKLNENNIIMKKGTLQHKQNSWFVRTIESGNELDEINFEYYPLSFTESREVELIEGKEVEFEIKSVSYIDVEGYGEELVKFAIVK